MEIGFHSCQGIFTQFDIVCGKLIEKTRSG